MRPVNESLSGHNQICGEANRDEYFRKNPLTGLACVAIVFIGFDLYGVLTAHLVTLSMVLSDAVLVTFIIMYFRRSAPAWFIIPLFGVVCVVESPFMFYIQPSRYPFG